MEPVLIKGIPFRIRIDSLFKRLRIEEGSRDADFLRQIVEEAERMAHLKALYRTSFIQEKGFDHVVVDGAVFKSRVLRVNLEKAYRVFPFVATCGTELEDWARSMEEMTHRFWADTIKEIAVRTALHHVSDRIQESFRLGKISRMNPGSLADWPLEEQRPLFKILGDTKEAIGVHLTESLMMIPSYSVSGVFFPTEESFESCQLCPRERCPGRRAPYDRDLYDRRYR